MRNLIWRLRRKLGERGIRWICPHARTWFSSYMNWTECMDCGAGHHGPGGW